MDLSRRTLLLGSVGLLAGCVVLPAAPPPGSSPGPGGGKPASVSALLASPRFLAAHRGSGDNWPEHTLTAYRNSLVAGAAAVEISVRRTADGQLVCHHDADTARVTGVSGLVVDATYDQLAARPVNARQWLGQTTPLEPIPLLADVLSSLPQDCLIFIEDKDGSNTQALLDLMDAQPNSKERFVWKQWAAAEQVAAARERGYRTWGYFTADILDRLTELAPRHDSLGVPVEQDDSVMKRFVTLGKPVIAWEVHTRYQRDRLTSLGLQGLMCANYLYVSTQRPAAERDSFASGTRAAGDLPADPASGWSNQPELQPGVDSITLNREGTPRYLMGSLAPTPSSDYTLSVTLGWVGPPASAHSRAGVSFAIDTDGPYHPRHANPSGSYQVFLDASGAIVLAYQAPSWTAAEPLAKLDHVVVATGHDVGVKVHVTGQQLTVSAAGQSATVNHMNARGGYLWLWGEQVTNGARFSGIQVIPD